MRDPLADDGTETREHPAPGRGSAGAEEDADSRTARARFGERAASILRTSPILGAVLTLMSGTLAAQLVAFVLQIAIARVYTDVDKGLLGVYGSITQLVITIAALRYDLAIVLPDSDAAARSVHRLAGRCVLGVSLATSLVLALVAAPLKERYHHSGELALWLVASGVTVALVAQAGNLRYWLTRKGRFGDIAANGVVNSLAIAGLQLLLGLVFDGGFTPLILGTMLGQAVSLLFLVRRTRDARESSGEEPALREVAARYKRMPLLNGPNALVDAVRNAGINLLIGAVAIGALGQFQLAWNIMQVPVGLIAGALGQVFLKKLSDTPRGEMHPLVSRILVRAALAAAVPFLLLSLLAPWLFPFVFGARWDQAGAFARALTPWLFMNVLTSPISNLFVITENQRRMLVFGVVYCLVPLAWLRFSPLGLLETATVLGFLMAAMLGGLVVMSLATAAQYDAGEEGR